MARSSREKDADGPVLVIVAGTGTTIYFVHVILSTVFATPCSYDIIRFKTQVD